MSEFAAGRPQLRGRPRRVRRTLLLGGLAAVLGGCFDPVMAEALSPRSPLELRPAEAPAVPGPAPAQPRELPTVAILPLGEVRPSLVKVVAAAVESALQARVVVLTARPLPQVAYYPPRKRWRAERLLEAVDADLPEGVWKTLVLVDVELSTTKGESYDWGIGGLGTIGGPSAVVSTYLVRKHSARRAQLEERLGKLAVHEVGHTLGLPHCEVMACVMSDAKGRLIRSLDGTTDHYCGRCRKVLPSEWLTKR